MRRTRVGLCYGQRNAAIDHTLTRIGRGRVERSSEVRRSVEYRVGLGCKLCSTAGDEFTSTWSMERFANKVK